VRSVMVQRMSNIQRALTLAAHKGQAGIVSTLLAFATRQGIPASRLIHKLFIYRFIISGVNNKFAVGKQAAVFKVLASANPNIINMDINHGARTLYEAVKKRQTDLVAVLLELGADPFHPVEPSKQIGSYNSSLMSFAAMAESPRITEMLLDHNMPVATTAALHTAARFGHLDTMRLLMQHGANLDEVITGWHKWTPMHFAASRGKIDAMKLLERSGARSDLEDADRKTPAQLLEEFNTAEQTPT